MIKRIEKFTLKSFKNYSGPESDFKLKNIIFGYNGKGKTSLANGIFQEVLKASNISKDNIRFFNSNYVKEALLLAPDDSKTIKGIVASFGEKDVGTEKQIKQLMEQIVDTTKLSSDVENLKTKLIKECDAIFEREKGGAKINKKKVQTNINDYLSQYEKDLDTALTQVSESELKTVKSVSEYEDLYEKIAVFYFTSLYMFSIDDINRLIGIFSKSYSDDEIPSSKVIGWLKEGVEIHEEDKSKKCKFCGAPITLGDITSRVDSYLNNEKQKDTMFLEEIISKYNSNVHSMIKENQILFESLFSKDGSEFYEPANNYANALQKLVNLIKTKIGDMNIPVDFDSKELVNAGTLFQNANSEMLNLKKQKLSALQQNITKVNDLIKGHVAYIILNDSLIKSNKNDILSKEEALKKETENNGTVRASIENLKRSKQPTKDFADFISELLQDLEIDIKLDVCGSDYVLKSLHNDDLSVDDISEGERNLLSLLFFYFEMFSDNQQNNFKGNIQMIIVDDPISSMDDINKMFVLSLVKRILDIEETQVFVLTHVWEDFVSLCYGKDKNENFAFYEVCKNEHGSFITLSKANETPYEHDFAEILNFSKKDNVTSFSECEIYHYPNIIRKVLEGFMGFKVKNNSATRTNVSNVSIALCNGRSPSNKDNIEIPVLLDVCNVYSHKSTSNPNEILRAAKFLMSRIKTADPVHFAKMENIAQRSN